MGLFVPDHPHSTNEGGQEQSPGTHGKEDGGEREEIYFCFFEKLGFENGKRSKREVEEFNIHPNVIKSLGVGECVVVRKFPRASAGRVKVRRSED